MNSHVLAWSRKFCSAAFGGAADGVLIGLGGSGAVSVATHAPVDARAILFLMAVNVLLDTARFVKTNSDPWEFAIPTPTPTTPVT